jgi:hypothetical protein
MRALAPEVLLSCPAKTSAFPSQEALKPVRTSTVLGE